MTTKETIGGIALNRIEALTRAAGARYAAARPRTQAALARDAGHYLGGVPMHWMKDWPQPFPMLVQHAEGAVLTDIDGNVVDDFCLGDTGSMFGHSPAPIAAAIAHQASRGLTYMLPTEDALAVGQLLGRTFGDFRWQIATTATDANRFALRVARAVTGRSKVLTFNGCYHGTVDDAMVALEDGRTVNRPGLLGQVADLAAVAVSCEFNDLASVEAALAAGDVAAILTEPVMTNCCMVLPEPGFHEELRDLADRYDAVLIIDETHTISSGYGGYTRVHGLRPDIFVVGKCIAGGVPAAVWGLHPSLSERYFAADAARPPGHSGMGTTLSANPLQFAALRASLEAVMTPAAYTRMEVGAERLAAGLAEIINQCDLPWHVVRVGARVEFICHPGPLANGAAAVLAHQPVLEAAIHMSLLDKGCLIAPFHNMMLVSPVTTGPQIDRLLAAFADTVKELT